ncbi:MucR family transcriptional regulator, partial [Nostoc sp. NIES-2111]
DFVADVVAAYVANNTVQVRDLPELISSVHASFKSAGSGKSAEAESEPLVPAVPVKKSITPDFLISLEDGRKYKTLKRHLSGLGLTPDEYRAKWGLKPDYPMVAPSYAARRSELAKAAGLGQQRRQAPPAPEPAPAATKRGRKPKLAS